VLAEFFPSTSAQVLPGDNSEIYSLVKIEGVKLHLLFTFSIWYFIIYSRNT